ncbi:MAG TPA: hypothetical protein VFA65_10575 [Bryobacteraceae bacterium]|nr:hypothetical protein [Bryobacteraceae bacterium]
MNNFTVNDLIGSLCGVVLFVPLMIPLGYTAAWFTDALKFKTISVPWRVLISLPLSISLGPILSYWAGSLFGWPAVWLLYGVPVAFFVLLLCGKLGHESAPRWFSALRQSPRISWLIAAIWLVVSILSLVDLQLGHRLYFSATVCDHSVRTAMTDAIDRTGVRPENPFYYLGSPAPLRYHYFWFIACSLVDRMGGQIVSARHAIIASVVWSGWGFAAIVPLFLRFVLGVEGNTLRRTAVVALALTTVTGLDILPTIYYWTQGIVFADMEWWNDQITSWWGSGLWVPHHLAALVIGLMALLLLWDGASEPTKKVRIAQGILAGIALATMVGTSIYVALVFAVFLTFWTITTWLLREHRHTTVLLAAGFITVALAVPFLLTLVHSNSGNGESAKQSVSFVQLTLRDFVPLDDWRSTHPIGPLKADVLQFALLPLNYFLELGFFLVAACLYLFKRRKEFFSDLSLVFTTLLMATSVLICTIFRSSVISNNDLGARGFLAAQFVFLLWAADLLISRSQNHLAGKGISNWFLSPVWAPLILIGTLGTAYEIGLLRFEGLLTDTGLMPIHYYSPDRQLGHRTYALRRAYDTLRTILPSDAVIQNNPKWNYLDYFYGLYSHHQTAVYDAACGTTFGGDAHKCRQIYPEIASLFEKEHNLTPDQVAEMSRRLDLNAIVVKDLDGAWDDRQSWIWQIAPAITNEYVRIYVFSLARLHTSNASSSASEPAHLGQF